ncbi:GH39 family glycosyl hydrolase [Metabacillus halosaccharovorans]|uniref:GH39 family glycosyl hydrolase n=1 Tax=Metabacillus halosaccharovorans TaxID=930124 RepID=UPI001C1F732E|nr:helix-turn-helix domain-containing protein [Metabacillus halosaccharovorans]MBU7591268.1 helix-turn-helix domain-containing protein [Metabacillus halosaccharovorans]
MISKQNVRSSVDSNLITISVMNNKNSLDHAHREVELIYIIKGRLQVKINNEIFLLKNSDFVVVNSNNLHSLYSDEENLFVVLHINQYQLSSLLSQKTPVFSCNSSQNERNSDEELRTNLEVLLSVYINQNNTTEVEFFEKAFNLLLTLSRYYLKKQEQVEIENLLAEKGPDERTNEILDYLQTNYREPLTLNEVASLHFLSVPYLSKFFKKQTGKTFSQYLNEIRLAHAVNELLNTDKPITRIALDNGFPNLSAFNRVFNEKHHTKPAEYRKKMSTLTKRKDDQTEKIKIEKNEAISELSHYLNRTTMNENLVASETFPTAETNIIKMGKMKAFTKYWNKIINIGYAKELLNSDMQEQITLLQSEICFKYARFWGLFGDDMHIEDRSGETINYNFSNTNKLLDFLIKNKLKPFIELGPKPKIISKSTDEVLIIQTSSEKSLEDWKNLIRAFLLHCIERYSIEEVETWYFEIWNQYTDPIPDESNQDKQKEYDPSQFQEYFRIFDVLKRSIKEIVPSAKVGGCGLTLRDQLQDLFLKQWKLEEVHPDFLSIYLYPIEIALGNNRVIKKNTQSANPDFIKDQLNQVRKSLRKAGFEDLELNVTEWNISVSNRDYLNDSCYKSAYMIRNIIENLNQNKISMLGYWLSSDIFSDYRDSKSILHGGAGLVTKSGIKKPSYHAFALLKQLGDILVEKGDGYIVTKKSGDRYQVLCYNYKHFDYSFYLHPEASLGINKQYEIFENYDVLNLSLELQGISNGKYRVKELRLNRSHGSVLDEWLKFGAVNDMKQDEVDYLKQICIPYMKVEHTEVANHSIQLKGNLEPQEVRLFECNLLYGQI